MVSSNDEKGFKIMIIIESTYLINTIYCYLAIENRCISLRLVRVEKCLRPLITLVFFSIWKKMIFYLIKSLVYVYVCVNFFTMFEDAIN